MQFSDVNSLPNVSFRVESFVFLGYATFELTSNFEGGNNQGVFR
jgi:hypothetical protein